MSQCLCKVRKQCSNYITFYFHTTTMFDAMVEQNTGLRKVFDKV